jgi:glutaminase
LANFLKSFGNIDNDVDEVLDFLFSSIEMTCKELAHSFFFLANEGKTKAGIPILESQVKRLNALMQTCGFMMIRNSPVGLPGKAQWRRNCGFVSKFRGCHMESEIK